MTIFYLGTHRPHWLAMDHGARLFVSRRRLEPFKKLPRARRSWALDSGGFTELSKYGRWMLSAREYVCLVRRFRDEVGMLEWAAQQDWMCENKVLAKTGLTVREHQARTVANFLELQELAPDLPLRLTLQGDTRDDYMRHADDFERAGISLRDQPLVCIGSVCRRQHTKMVEALIADLSPHMRLHGFGFKKNGLKNCANMLASSDSMSWSYAARKSPPMEGHPHKNCANCFDFAMAWHDNLQTRLKGWLKNSAQTGFDFVTTGGTYAANQTRCSAA